MSIRSILRNKKRNLDIVPSPYTRGTTLNKLANMIVCKMQLSGKKFNEIFKHTETQHLIVTHNMGEFRRYPLKGRPGCFEELLKLAVSKKMGTVIR
ncbi:MAG: hypothetical protein WC998_04395 [Candidatus Paceibacterota bacterium]|jgi:hypothetical protein